MCPHVDPSDFTRKPRTFLYSEAGAATIRRTDADYISFAITADANLAAIESVIATTNDAIADARTSALALTVDGDRNTGIPAYRRTSAHTGTYNETYDRLWCTLFGPEHPHSRHARDHRDQ